MMELYSFDVYDTVLVRLVVESSHVFLLLGQRLAAQSLIPCTPEAFARLRVEARHRAQANNGGEPTLRQIYAELGHSLGLTKVECDVLMDQECALEAELLRVVPPMRDRVAAARRGGPVAFVSDIHFPAAFIQDQLARHGLWQEGDRVYASCEYGVSKGGGALFRQMLQEAGPGTKAFHLGNDPHADVEAPKSVGVRAEFFRPGNPNRYERILASQAWATEGLTAVLAGASRLARLSVEAASPKEQAIRDVSAGVAAPTLAGYVLWLLRQARRLNLRRLYFLSRDGQILVEIARKLAPRLNIDCEIRYLYGSRRAWCVPTFPSLSDEQILRVLFPTHFCSVRSVLSMAAVDPVEIREDLRSIGLPEEQWSRNLDPAERMRLRSLLWQRSTARDLILDRAAQEKRMMLAYLEQEGMLDAAASGVVDVIGSGTARNALITVLSSAGGPPPVYFYFGLGRDSAVDHRLGPTEVYFYDRREGLGPQGIPSQLLEAFCSGDHGMVLRYEDDGGRVRPRLKAEQNRKVLDWGLPVLRSTVSAFADNLLLDSSLVNPWSDVRPATAELLKVFWSNPSALEAEVFGAFPREATPTGERWDALARGLTLADLARVLTGSRVSRRWYEASVAVSAPHIRALIQGYRLLRRIGNGRPGVFRKWDGPRARAG